MVYENGNQQFVTSTGIDTIKTFTRNGRKAYITYQVISACGLTRTFYQVI